MHERHRLDLEGARKELEAVHRVREEARRMKEDAHRLRQEENRARHEERARQSGKRPLDANRIAAAAVAIADAQGVDEVSMRKIAAIVGSGTMSLYHYVKTKDELLVLMEDMIMGEILVPPSALRGGWREGVSAIARHTREAYRRHPWALTLQTRGEPGENGLRHVEQSMAALSQTPLSFEDRMTLSVVVDDYVFGHSLRATDKHFTEKNLGPTLNEIADFIERHVASGEFPEMAKALGEGDPLELVDKMTKSFDPDAWFEAGLTAILDGLAKRFGLDG